MLYLERVLLFVFVIYFISGFNARRRAKENKADAGKPYFRFAGLVLTVFLLIMGFSSIYTFRSPEAVFRLYYFPVLKAEQVVSGRDSDKVIGRGKESYVVMYVPKTENGWRFRYGFHGKMVKHVMAQAYSITVDHPKNTEDYYVDVFVRRGPADVTDNRGSEFICMSRTDSYGVEDCSYYAAVYRPDDSYQLYIDGEAISVFEERYDFKIFG